MRIHCSASSPPSLPERWQDRWCGPDGGLIACWLRGREKAREAPDVAARARAGELPVLAWKGGVDRAIKAGNKLGALEYLATWQGLRGDDLDIDPDNPPAIRCARTGVLVTFTTDWRALLKAASDAGNEGSDEPVPAAGEGL